MNFYSDSRKVDFQKSFLLSLIKNCTLTKNWIQENLQFECWRHSDPIFSTNWVNSFYMNFIMLAYTSKDGWWWYISRGWIFLRISQNLFALIQITTDKILSDMKVYELEVHHWISPSRKDCTHWHLLTLAECLQKPNSRCEHS